jgi:septal ring factor EnvC (AmiA/AmiB activator)
MSMIVSYIDSIELIIKVFQKLIRRNLKSIRVGPIEIELKKSVDNSYNATLKKINDAQTHFSEAIEAIELLKTEYLEENERFGNLMNELKTKKAEYEKTSNELDLTKNMLQKDQEALKKVLGIDERRLKIAGFLSGVIASIVATAIWVYGPKIWKWIIALVTNQV